MIGLLLPYVVEAVPSQTASKAKIFSVDETSYATALAVLVGEMRM